MLDDIFDLNKFNIIQDEENYYLFRALNNGDYSDITSGITFSDGVVKRIRTDLERYEGTPLYSSDDEISLEEIHDHIKYVHRRDTNCISLSTNTCVSITYGKGSYHNQYAMITIPKDKFEENGYYFAGKILIEEINKRISKIIDEGNLSSDKVEILKKIDSATTQGELLNILQEYSSLKTNTYTFNKSKYYDLLSLDGQQNLEKNRILAKIDIIDRKLLSRSSNTMLLETIKFAFTSCEMLHYKSIDRDFELISPVIVDLFSLLQEAKCLKIDEEKVKILELKVLDCAKKGMQLNDRKFGSFNTVIEDEIDIYNDVKISDIYNMTGGKIPYTKARKAFLFNKSIARSKLRTSNLCDLLKEIIDDSSFDNVINEIENKCCVVDPNFISVNRQEGKQICDTVCIDINRDSNRRDFSSIEQNALMNYIASLSDDDKKHLIIENDLASEETICELLSDTREEEISLNRYYAEIILDYLNLDEIYKSSYLQKVLTKDERELLISSLDKANCINMYESLIESKLVPEAVSGIIFNLLLNNGYQGMNFIDLSNSDEFKDIILRNLENINTTVSAVRMDYLLGIRDNDNLVPNSNINLRDYQKLAVDRVNEIFNTKNYAGVVLPTGAGKSFVAIAEMLRYSDKNILYYAPNREILRQIQKHIVKHVLNLNVIPEIQEAYYRDHPHEIPEDFIFQSDIEEMISVYLPHLKMYCYQGLTTKDDEFFENRDAGLIILDEVHRTGAQEWNEKVKLLLEKNPKTKILAITATPVRDVDNQNMVEKLAEFSGTYTKEEIIQKKYMASEMYLVDAMQEGIVVTPNIVTFDYFLGESAQFKEAKELYENETDPAKKGEMKKVYDDMRKVVEISQKNGMSQTIKEAFEKNRKSLNGRYIIFLPPNSMDMPTEEYILEQIEKTKEYFKEIDPEPEVEYLLSNRKQKSANLSAISRFENETGHLKLLFAINMLNEGVHVDGIDGVMMLRPLGAGNKILYYQQIGRCIYSLDPNHELEPSEFPVIFDVYNNYYEQNIDRQVNRHTITSDLQKMYQIEDWITKHFRFPDINSESIDESRKASTLKRIQKKYSKYLTGPINDPSLSKTDIYEIQEIVNIGLKINLWDIEIPKKLIKSKGMEDDTEKISAFEVKGEQKKFVELFKQMGKISAADSMELKKMELVDAINILDILVEYNFPINDDTISLTSTISDIYKELPSDILELVKPEISVDDDFEIGRCLNSLRSEFYWGNSMFLDYDIKLLRKMGIFEKYHSGYSSDNKAVNDKGFIISGPRKYKNMNIYTGTYFDEDGFNIIGIDEQNFTAEDGFINKYGFGRDGYYYELDDEGNYIKTDSLYNPNGFDVSGNYCEKQADGSYVPIGKLDPYGFNIDGVFYKYNSRVKEYVDTGFVLDEHYFDRDGLYWAPTGKKLGYRKRELVYSDGQSLIFDDAKYYSRSSITDKTKPNQSSRIQTNLPYDLNYFDRDGYYYCLDENNRRVKSNLKYNERFLDRDGYYYELQPDGTRIKTNRMYDDNFYGLDRHYYAQQLDGTRKKSSYIIDVDSLNCPGLVIKYTYDAKWDKTQKYVAFDTEGIAYSYQNGKFVKSDPPTKISKYGFDVHGYYHKLLPDGTRDEKPSNSMVDEHGFDECGVYKLEKDFNCPLVDKRGFSQDGCYWVMSRRGKKFTKTSSKVDEHGFDIDMKFDFKMSDGSIVKRPFNNRFLSYDGYYFKRVQEDDGTIKRVKTGRRIDARGFDIDGTHYDVLLNEKTKKHVLANPMPYDEHGFDVDKVYWEKPTITYRNGVTRELDTKRIKTNPPREYDNRHFNFKGFYCIVENGKVTVTDSKYDPKGYDRDGYNVEGYDENGYDREGYNKEGYNSFGYNREGYDRDGYKMTGYNDEGYDRQGRDKSGRYKDENEGTIVTEFVYDTDGFDQHGFDKNGIHKITHLPYDEKYFKKDGINIITSTKFSLAGYDIYGNYDENRVSSYAKKYMYNDKKHGLECVGIARMALSASSIEKAYKFVPGNERNKKVLSEKLFKYIIAAAVLDDGIKKELEEYVINLLKKIEELKIEIEKEKAKIDTNTELIKAYKQMISEYKSIIKNTNIGDIYGKNI